MRCRRRITTRSAPGRNWTQLRPSSTGCWTLDADRGAPRKQRHTARRIHRRILKEFPDATVAQSTVRNHVRERRHAMGLVRRETFVPQSYGLAAERDHLLRLAAEGFDLAEVTFPLVDKQGCVTVKTNAHSVPAPAGSRLEARVYPLHVEIWQGGRRIARHERCHARRQQVVDLEHYLDVLGHKPGALAGSRPLEQCRPSHHGPAQGRKRMRRTAEPQR